MNGPGYLLLLSQMHIVFYAAVVCVRSIVKCNCKCTSSCDYENVSGKSSCLTSILFCVNKELSGDRYFCSTKMCLKHNMYVGFTVNYSAVFYWQTYRRSLILFSVYYYTLKISKRCSRF